MGQSYEIYNIITSPDLQVNSRFIPYYKTATQATPTGTMMGELGIKFAHQEFHLYANDTIAYLNDVPVDLTREWSSQLEDVTVTNFVDESRRMYQITIANKDVMITFIRKVYIVADLERQWHYDYRAKLLSSGEQLHGLLGQTWESKYFVEKSGSAFQFLDGFEDNYHVKSNNIFGDDFSFNRFNNY